MTTAMKIVLSVAVTYMDLIKDTALLIILGFLLQGIVFKEFLVFSSQVFWHLAISITAPLLLSAMKTAYNNPELILGFTSWQQWKQTKTSGWKVWLVQVITVIFYPLVPGILIIARDEANQTKKEVEKKLTSNNEMKQENMKRFNILCEYLEDVNTALLLQKRNETSLENSVQLTIQMMTVLLSRTKTATNPGLEVVFQESYESSWLGGDITTQVLIVSILLSFFMSSITYVKIRTDGKNIITSVFGKMIIFLRALVVTITRMGCFLAYLTPFLGLLNILAHWKGESIRYYYGAVDVWNVNLVDFKTVNWITDLDRGEYNEDGKFIPVGYSAYTGVRLWAAYVLLTVLLCLQCLLLLLVKMKLSKTFQAADTTKKITHVLEVVNLPAIFGDWDQGDQVAEVYQNRFKDTQKEMGVIVVIHYFFNMLLLTPIFVTGQ